MTVVTRAITPKVQFPSYILTSVERTQQGDYYPIGLSVDGTVFFARNGSGLYQTTNDGVTWTLIYTFPTAVTGICETKQGECLVQIGSTGNTKLYRSTGWSVNKATATWELVLTVIGDRSEPNWSLRRQNMGANGVIVYCEYGGNTTEVPANDEGKARRVLLSENDGKTWKVIYDISTSGAVQYGKGLHIHGCCYHEADDRIYFTYGDGTGTAAQVAGAGFIWVGYSDDRGATWSYIPTPTDFFTGMQFTTISAFDANLVLLPDGVPYGICVIPRTGYRTLGQMRFVNQYTTRAPSDVIGQVLFKAEAGPHRPLIATYNWFGAIPTRNRITVSADDGTTWNEAWHNTDPLQSNGGMTLYGPSLSGKVLGHEVWSNGGLWAKGTRFLATLTPVTV